MRQITEGHDWRSTVIEYVAGNEERIDRGAFDSYWIEAGHRIREQVADDGLLITFLRRILEPYHGGPMTLYRGENLNRWNSKSIGLAWTFQRGTAEMFARGLNAVQHGGVLLQGVFPAASIIHGPNKHSTYLGELQFTVDPMGAASIEEVRRFPPALQGNTASET